MTIEGRMFPVDVHYALDPVPDYVKATVETVMKIHRIEKEGDVLCFLTGQEEVKNLRNPKTKNDAPLRRGSRWSPRIAKPS